MTDAYSIFQTVGYGMEIPVRAATATGNRWFLIHGAGQGAKERPQ